MEYTVTVASPMTSLSLYNHIEWSAQDLLTHAHYTCTLH